MSNAESLRIVLGVLAVVIGAVSLTCIAGNFGLLGREIKAKPGEKTPSLIPIIGGLLGHFALRLCPLAGWSRWAWLAPLLDPGCYVIYFLVMPIAWRFRGHALTARDSL